MDFFFHGSLEFKLSATLVNSQLVCPGQLRFLTMLCQIWLFFCYLVPIFVLILRLSFLTRGCDSLFITALAARCLEVVTIHIPVFKAHFEQRLPPKQYVLLSQFDQILKVSMFSLNSSRKSAYGWKGGRKRADAGGLSSVCLPLAFAPINWYLYTCIHLVERHVLRAKCLASTKNTAHRPLPPAMAWTYTPGSVITPAWREALQSFAILHPKEEIKQ